MKIFALFLFLFSVFASLAFAQIQITEIMYNPDGRDEGREWIEMVNLGTPLNIEAGRDGWRLFDGKNHYLRSADFNWNSNEVIIFVQDKAKFLKDFPALSVKMIESSFYLKNSAGAIKLLDINKNTLAAADYHDIADEGFSIVFSGSWRQGQRNGAPGVYPDINVEVGVSKPIQSPEIQNTNSTAPNVSQLSPIQTLSQVITTTTQTPNFNPEFLFPHYLSINEFLPNELGKDDDEFIELLNEDGAKVNLSDYWIKIGDKKIKLTGETSDKFVVLWKQDYQFNIRNKGESIALFYKNKQIHKISYSGLAAAGESFSKINNDWVWIQATPGEENKLIAIKKQFVNQQTKTKNSQDEDSKIFQEEFLGNAQSQIKDKIAPAVNFNPLIVGFLFAAIIAIAVIVIVK
jgi:hypothetical protein